MLKPKLKSTFCIMAMAILMVVPTAACSKPAPASSQAPALTGTPGTKASFLTTTPTSTPVSGARVREWISDLDSNDFAVKRSSIKFLGYSGDRTAVAPLLKFLNSKPHPVLRNETYVALGRIGDPSSESVVTDALANESQDFWDLWLDGIAGASPGEPVIKADIVAIGRPMIGQLNKWLTHNNSKVRQMAAQALDEIMKE